MHVQIQGFLPLKYGAKNCLFCGFTMTSRLKHEYSCHKMHTSQMIKLLHMVDHISPKFGDI